MNLSVRVAAEPKDLQHAHELNYRDALEWLGLSGRHYEEETAIISALSIAMRMIDATGEYLAPVRAWENAMKLYSFSNPVDAAELAEIGVDVLHDYYYGTRRTGRR